MADLLKKYRQMRDFAGTPEPSGAEKRRRAKMPIFVIQKHQASHLHYDFRLEMEGVLKSWAVPKGPSYDPGTKRLAMMTEDHPYDYADFEGVIPAGNYGAGNVIIWDEGSWEFIEPGSDPVKALKSGKLTFRLYGRKMFGEWALVRIKGRSPKGNEWLLLKHRDHYANEKVDVTEVAPRSVVSNRLLEEVSPDRTWQSNRPAAGRSAPTLASRLAAEKKRASPPPGKPRGRNDSGDNPEGGLGNQRSRPDRPRASATTKSKRSPTSGAAPRPRGAQSRAASSPSRSSRARSPRKAEPTPRRRPR